MKSLSYIVEMFNFLKPLDIPKPDDLYAIFRSKARAKVFIFLLQVPQASFKSIMMGTKLPESTVIRAICQLKEMDIVEFRGKMRQPKKWVSNGKQISIWGLKST
jgi:hypothetical protein